ncbi:hypothetical protein MRB53_036958 [Persea americana]|nr:hypothetical protein MRB53_036958 [Persea americana]
MSTDNVPRPLHLPDPLDDALPRIHRHLRAELHLPRRRLLPRGAGNTPTHAKSIQGINMQQITAPINDAIYRRLRARNNGVGLPEFRCVVMLPGACLVPIGLFLYGWTAQEKVFWLAPNVGAAIFSAGVIVGFQSVQTYIVDAYTKYAASAVAAATILRSLAGFGFPLFGPSMYRALDYGWGNSVIAFVGIVLGLPAPMVLWFFGARLRAKSRFAAGE